MKPQRLVGANWQTPHPAASNKLAQQLNMPLTIVRSLFLLLVPWIVLYHRFAPLLTKRVARSARSPHCAHAVRDCVLTDIIFLWRLSQTNRLCCRGARVFASARSFAAWLVCAWRYTTFHAMRARKPFIPTTCRHLADGVACLFFVILLNWLLGLRRTRTGFKKTSFTIAFVSKNSFEVSRPDY